MLVAVALALSAAQADHAAAAADFRTEQAAAVREVTAGERALDEAIALLQASAGRVLTEQPRIELAAAIDTSTARLAVAAQELTAAESVAESSTERLREFDFAAAASVDGIVADLADPVTALTQAMAQWQAEQDRLLRERYTNNVHAVGWTPELDACTGSVDVTAHYLGVPTIAEHWSCGGKDFPDDAGTLITLTGVHAGTFRVEGIVAMLNADVHSAADLPRGFDLLYQTCQDGYSATMSFTALTRIS